MSEAGAPARKRFRLVDALRGVAACAVMLYHYLGGELGATLAPILSRRLIDAARWGWLGVQVFFVLSGFVIALAMGERAVTFAGAARFAVRRQVRLDPPYWVSLALSCAITWAWRLHLHDNRPAPGLGRIAAHLVYMQELLGVREIQPIYWTLAIEVQFYLVLVLGLALLRPVRRHAAWALLASGAWSLHGALAWRFPHGWFVTHWYLFTLGALAWWTQRRPAALAAFAAFAAWTLHAGVAHDRAEPVAGALTAITLAVAARAGGLERWLAWRPLVFLGAVSYGIYLLHPIVGAQVRWLVGPHVNPRTPLGALVILVCATGATVAAAWALHVAVERPAMRLASRIRWSE